MTDHVEDKNSSVLFWLNTARLLFIGMWFGAAVFFSFSLAPSVFAVLPSRELAGAVVQRNLTVINLAAFWIGILGLMLSVPSRRWLAGILGWIELALIAIMTAAGAIGHWVIAARLRGLREQMDRPIDLVAATDPIRVTFNQLHGYSVTVLTIGMVAALAAWLLIARQTRITTNRAS